MFRKVCPLCHGTNCSVIDSAKPSILIDEYASAYGIDIARHFNGCEMLWYRRCNECGLLYFDPMVTGDAPFYRDLQQFDWYYTKDKWEFSVARDLLTSDSKVLEVGAGCGFFGAGLVCGEYVGLETSPDAIALAKHAGVTLREQLVEEHALDRGDYYDVVCSFQVLEHVSDVKGFVQACVQCLRPGGKLVLSTPTMDGFMGFAVNSLLNLPPHHVTHWAGGVWAAFERLFPLRLMERYYEPLQEYHRDDYSYTLLVALARRMMGLERLPLVDVSTEHDEAVVLAEKIRTMGATLLEDERLTPARGHSVAVVYEKTFP